MMNLTLSSLSIHFLTHNSPLLTKLNSRNSFSIFNLELFHSFSPLISGYAPSLLNIKHSKFKYFLSQAISLNNQNFFNQQFSQKLDSISESTVNISDCQFIRCFPKENSYDGCEGGAILCRGVMLHLSKTLFRSNYAFKAGGAVRISCSAISEISNCQFYENSVTNYAAALSAFNVFELSISNCSFFYNHAKKMNSALGLALCPLVTLTNLRFGKNYAKNGGTMMFEASTIHLNSVISYKNNQSDTGSIFTSNSTILNIINGQFTEESDDIPSIISTSDDTINISNCTFSNGKHSYIETNGANINVDDTLIYSKTFNYTLPVLIQLNNNQQNESLVDSPEDEPWNIIQTHVHKKIKVTAIAAHLKQPYHSKIMFISYIFVIILLAIGIKMYFSSGSQKPPDDLSGLFDEDDQATFLIDDDDDIKSDDFHQPNLNKK